MKIKRLFNKVPAQNGQIKLGKMNHILPRDIYDYALAYRNVYTRSMPMLKRIKDPKWAEQHEIRQFYGKAQALAAQIAFSNELLLKAILWGSSRTYPKEHNLKKLINSLDKRYIEIIKKHLVSNGLKSGRWNNVLDITADTFIVSRYGFDNGNYTLDFLTLQLLNEALDYIYNNKLPDWTTLTENEQKDRKHLQAEVDKIFDEKYQKEQRKLWRLWNKVFDE